jgi:hypothetical protein
MTIGLAVMLAAVAFAACSSSTPTASSSTTAGSGLDTKAPAQAPSTSVGAQPPANAAVRAAYRGFWDALVTASATSDATFPALAQHATGAELAALRARLAADKRAGLVARGEPQLLETTIARLDAKAATIQDCMDSNRWLFHDAKTGALRDKPSRKRYAVTARLVLDHGVWKVATLDFQEARCGG